jgi:hypothetical protein
MKPKSRTWIRIKKNSRLAMFFASAHHFLKRPREDTFLPSPKRLRWDPFSEEYAQKLVQSLIFCRRLERFFLTYQTKEGVIGPAGIIRLCQALEISPLDISLLVIAYLLKVSCWVYLSSNDKGGQNGLFYERGVYERNDPSLN